MGMMVTLVLIVMRVGTGLSTTTLEGYHSMEACKEAGALWMQTAIGEQQVRTYSCIPQPRAGWR